MRFKFFNLFDLRHDQDDAEAIDTAIRSGVQVRGTNLWVLIFAILIASIGLNVNSTAVIIGAMLISPLMGPIIGIGYGAGINDFALIKRAFRNLGIFVAISLTTAILYFLVTPLSQAQSELLARTTPTLWDVLIAFFGGAAGIVALTRKDISNVVPGVAMATALMPPLCTAGYGIATGNPEFFIGAFYLFSINSVFIAFATLLFVKLLKLPQHTEIDLRVRRRTRLFVGVAIFATLLPSAVLAYRLVQQEVFATAADRLIRELDRDKRFILLAKDVSPSNRSVVLTMGGEPPPVVLAQEMERRFADAGIPRTRVTVRYAGAEKLDLPTLKLQLQEDLYRNTLRQVEAEGQRIKELEDENRRLKRIHAEREALLQELRAQYPEAASITVANGERAGREDGGGVEAIVVFITTNTEIPASEQTRLRAWLAVRFAGKEVDLHVARMPQDRQFSVGKMKKRRA